MGFDIMNQLDIIEELAGKKLTTNKEQGKLEQFEKCDVKTCIYYNEGGECCSYETCRVKVDDPLASSMITKICQFCGNEFSTSISGMAIQVCPACLEAALKAEGHPHECMFCGQELDGNPSFFFPCCDECLEKLMIVIHGSESSLEMAANDAHC